MRHNPPTLATAQLLHRYRHDKVVAFDIAGAEAPFPPLVHREAFDYCAEHFLAVTCHAGEVTDPTYIRDALMACRSLRIGHGVQLIQEWGPDRRLPGPGSLTRWILDRQIPLEVCLSSNLQTRASSNLSTHPFGDFFGAGLAVTLNTDNRLVSSTSLTNELALAQAAWSLTVDDLVELQRTSLRAAFCDGDTKKRILAKYFLKPADTRDV